MLDLYSLSWLELKDKRRESVQLVHVCLCVFVRETVSDVKSPEAHCPTLRSLEGPSKVLALHSLVRLQKQKQKI